MEEQNVMSRSETVYEDVAARLANSEIGYGYVPTEQPVESVIEIEDKLIRLFNGAELPTSICAKTGRPATRVVSKQMRDPLNPFTWYGKRPSVEIGLCKKEFENRMVAISLTWAVFGLGVLTLTMGALNVEPLMIGVGLMLMLVSGVFRARVPIWTDLITEDQITVLGTGKLFRDLLESDRFAAKIERE